MSHDIHQIANMPTSLMRSELDASARGYHESMLRSWHIVAKLKKLIEMNTPHEVILEILALMESDLFQPYAWHEQRYKDQYSTGQATESRGESK